MTKTTKKVIHILCMVLAATLFELFFLLCLQHFYREWSLALYLSVLIAGSLVNLAILVTDVVCCILNKAMITRTCITTYVLIDFLVIFLYILVRTGFFDIIRDEESFQTFLERSGKWMAVLFVVLQFLQVVILPIPSTVTVVAGAALFGPLVGSLLSLLGIVIGSLIAFLVGRYAGYRVVAWLVGKDTLDKWLKKIKGKDKLLLSAMFILPVFPDDILCFVAGISSMSLPLFLGIIVISRVAAIFMTCYSVTLIPLNTWWGLLTWGLLIVAVVVLFVFLYKKSDSILNWFAKKFHKETRIEEKVGRDEFTVEIVTPNGDLYEKGVKKSDESGKEENRSDKD
ncbi:MAG: TVP38/TMEM64 family protein [Clostridia bacterium]|nr:TVP38/TMEM64 family protein [Clostridia bacterium]